MARRSSKYILAIHLWTSAQALIMADVLPPLRRAPSSFLAQTTALCQPEFSWMQNSKAQSPCLVAAFVSGACASNTWNVPFLRPGEKYDMPNATTANVCTCSWAAYNLLSACTACQGDSIALAVQNWDAYRTNCTNFESATRYFPENVTFPSSSFIPFWASIKPSTWPDAHFDAVTARSYANQGKADLNPSTGPSSNASKPSVPKSAIVGGVIGGAAVVAMIIVSIVFCCRYKHGTVTANSTGSTPSGGKVVDIRPQWQSQPYYGHQRSMSNMSQSTITSEASYLGMQQVATAFHNSANTSASPPPLPTSPPMSPPQLSTSPPMLTTSPQASSPTSMTQSTNLTYSSSLRSLLSLVGHRPPNVIVPFTDTQPFGSGITRKEAEDIAGAAIVEQEEEEHATASNAESSEDSPEPPRPVRRLNPPAYTPFPAGIQSHSAPDVSQRRRRPTKGSSQDSMSPEPLSPGGGNGGVMMRSPLSDEPSPRPPR